MTSTLEEIVAELDEVLEPDKFADYGPNGLQVPGSPTVDKLVSGVSANVELFEAAASQGANAILVHHGLFWGERQSGIDAAQRRRLKLLLDHDISLIAYHLPLDGHPTMGNNALIAAALGAVDTSPFAAHQGAHIGCLATFEPRLVALDLVGAIAELTDRETLHFDAGPPTVGKVAIASGAGTSFLGEAIAAGADAFLTGEPSERAMAQAREGSIHYIAAGHYATETFGVKRLGAHLAERFGIEHAFIDVPNPI